MAVGERVVGVGGEVERPGKGGAALGLDGVEPRPGRQHAEGDGVGERLDAAAGQRPAAHLHEQPGMVDAASGQLFGQFEAERAAAVDREQVVGALAAEGHGALGDELACPQYARIADFVVVSFAGPDVGAQAGELVDHTGVGPWRDMDRQWSSGCPGDNGGSERCVTARGNGKRGVDGNALDLEVDRQPEEVAGLVGARDVAGLVLGPEPTPLADGLGHLCYAEEWRGAKARAVHLGDGVIEAPDEVDVGTVVEPCSEGGVVRPEQVAEPDERIGIVAVLRVGTRPDGTGRGAQPADRAGERHDPERTPVRALNSSIMSSQTGASSWTPFQKPWSRRIS